MSAGHEGAWFKRFPNGGTAYVRADGSAGGSESEARPEESLRENVAEHFRAKWGYAELNESCVQAADEAITALWPELERLTFERDAAQATADNIAQQLEDLRDDVLGDSSLHVLEVASAAGREVERLTAEVERLTAELGTIRGELADFAQESMPSGVSTLQAVRWLIAEHDEQVKHNEELGDENGALCDERDRLREGLRGMARRVSELRQSLKFADAHVPQWERIISERQKEIERLRLDCHEKSVRATEEFDARMSLQAQYDQAVDENGWLSEACRLTVREAAGVRAERDRLLKDATHARQTLVGLIGGDWTVEPSLSDLAHYAARFWGDDRRELAARAEWKQAAEAEAALLDQEQAERRAEVAHIREQLAAAVVLPEDAAEQVHAALEVTAGVHTGGQLTDQTDAVLTLLRSWGAASASVPVVPKSCTCNGGWSVDENYQPEDYERNEPLRPGKGLIPCGFCNHGGWDAPWPPETEVVAALDELSAQGGDYLAAPQTPGTACSEDELVEQTSRRLQQHFRLRIGHNTRQHIKDGQESIPLSLRECDDVAHAAVTALKKVTRA